MDPVSALGVAAATVQFLDFSLKALALCRQIRDDVQGATQANKELEQFAKAISSSRADLLSAQNKTTSAGKRISKSATECIQAADDLMLVLTKVRSAGNKTLLNTANTVLRALKQGRTIEKLENRLRACQANLDSALLQDIHITQHAAFPELEGQVQTLHAKLQELQLESSRNNVTVQTRLDDIRSQNTSLITTLTSHQSSSTQQLSLIQKEMHSRFDRLDITDMKIQQQEVLNSLFFPELTAREEHVKFPDPSTFEWIFNSNISGAPSFSDWLQSSGTSYESIYWISGKAGSGKSTLMRHLASSPLTRDYLRRWTNGDDLRILKHFFWKPGTQLQTSIDGLLRSLLYQLLQNDSDLITAISIAQSLVPGRIPVWTAERLRTAIGTALSHLALRNPQQRICVFIDGLDEYQGSDSGVEELMEVIFTLANTPLVKICVSSRPEIAFSTELSLYPNLAMEKLNYDDIRQYVWAKTHHIPSRWSWDTRITKMAEGVFLWAVLVVGSIRQGYEQGDDAGTLEQHLQSTPREIHDLLVQTMERVKPHHRESLGLYFSLARYPQMSYLSPLLYLSRLSFQEHIPDVPDLALMSAARLPGPLDLQFAEHCEQTRKQVIAQSCGLLEVEMHPLSSAGPIWQTTGGDGSIVDKHCPLIANRVLVDEGNSTSTALDSYARSPVTWLHRSIYDVVSDTSNNAVRSKVKMLSEEAVLTMVVRAKLRLLALMPSANISTEDGDSKRLPKSLAEHVAHLVQIIGKASEGGFPKDKVVMLLDEVWEVVSCLHYKSLGYCYIDPGSSRVYGNYVPVDPAFIPSKNVSREKVVCADLFTTLCFKFGLIEYIQQRLGMLDCFDDNGWLFARMILCCYCAAEPSDYASREFGRFDCGITDDFARAVVSFIRDALPYMDRQRRRWENVDPEPISVLGYAWVSDEEVYDISWTRRCDPDHAAYENKIISDLALVYRKFAAGALYTREGKYYDDDDDTPITLQDFEFDLLGDLEQFLGYWDVYIGVMAFEEHQLEFEPALFQVSLNTFRLGSSALISHSMFPSTSRKGYTLRVLVARGSIEREDQRDGPVEYDWTKDHFVFNSRLDCGPKSLEDPDLGTEYNRTLHDISEEVKEDSHGQLNAQQQATLSHALTEMKLSVEQAQQESD